jgi:very-short-patch-repair endonuclease/predicted transcriptional regulator of viral defense system
MKESGVAMPAGDTDARILLLASSQHGIVTRSQLMHAGVPEHAIEYRLKKGRLCRLHRGVYRTGPVAAAYHREVAAVLACGERAVLSHDSASALLGLTPRHGDTGRVQPRTAPVDVTGPRTLRGPGHGVRLHRTNRIEPDEIRRRHGIPVTSPARTLLDLASIGVRRLERIVARAERQGMVTRGDVETLLNRYPRRRGTRRLRALIAEPPALTRSEAEARFLELARSGHLPHPATNAVVCGMEVDFVWPDRRLIVEIDGFVFHCSRVAFETDRDRDSILAAAGFRVIRFTWRQLTRQPEVVLVRLAQALAFGKG